MWYESATAADTNRNVSASGASLQGALNALRRLPTDEFLVQLKVMSKVKNRIAEFPVFAYELVCRIRRHEASMRPVAAKELQNSTTLIDCTGLLAVLRGMSSFNLTKLHTFVKANPELFRGSSASDDCASWISCLVDVVEGGLAHYCSSISFSEAIEALHLLGLLAEDLYFENAIETLVDNVRLHFLETAPLEAVYGEELLHLSILLDCMHTFAASLLVLASHQRHLATLQCTTASSSSPLRSGSLASVYSTEVLANLAAMLHVRHHPVANESFFLLVTNRLVTLLLQKKQEISGVSGSTWFFLLRSLSKLPWVNNACVEAVIPLLMPLLKRDASMHRGISLLLGRPAVSVTDIDLVIEVLSIVTRDLKLLSTSVAHSIGRGGASAVYIDRNKLHAHLASMNHMMQVALRTEITRRPTSAEHPSDGKLRLLQSLSKSFYTAIADNTLATLSSAQDLFAVRLVDSLLHHLVCVAPKELVQHPLVTHLAFAMTQVLPTIQASAATKLRALAVTDRLVDEGIMSDDYKMSFVLLNKYPLLYGALVDGLEHRRRHALKKHGSTGRGSGSDISYRNNDVLVRDSLAIVFSPFRKVVLDWQAEAE